jgi:hypothetical protein
MKLLIILALLTWSCSSSRMIKSKHGPIHKYQERQIKRVTEYFEFDDDGRAINHRNDKGILTPGLTWSDLQILGIDSLKVKFLEYN